MNDSPIGIFDSGIGGLTVLRETAKLLPNEDVIYLGDTARVPYGSKSRETVIRYSFEDANFLVKHGIKLLVVACNTATGYALGELKKSLSIPVVGVIEPGAKNAVKTTKTKRIGIIGTEGTIKSNSYVNEIMRLSGHEAITITEHGEKRFDRYFEIRAGAFVIFTKACPLFVPLAEEGWTDNEVTRLTVETYLRGIKDEGVDVLLLGCTHYPLLTEAIGRFMGKATTLIDSASATAVEVKRVLAEKGLLSDKKGEAVKRIFVTDSPERFLNVGRRFLGGNLKGAELVSLGN